MVYCAVAGCYNHSNKKNTTERLVISVYHLIKVFVGRGWVKLGDKTSQQIPDVLTIKPLLHVQQCYLKTSYTYYQFPGVKPC